MELLAGMVAEFLTEKVRKFINNKVMIHGTEQVLKALNWLVAYLIKRILIFVLQKLTSGTYNQLYLNCLKNKLMYVFKSIKHHREPLCALARQALGRWDPRSTACRPRAQLRRERQPPPSPRRKKSPTCPARERKVKRRMRTTTKQRRMKREKKKVERLTMQVSSLLREPFTIAQGKGQKLCEMERIHFFLSKKKTDELRNLHKLLYNRPGTVSSLKKNVGQFSGFPFEKGSIQYKKKEEMLKKFRNAMLKSICEVLDLERSGVNSELVKRILNFLMHPKPSGKPLPKSKKSSSKGNKKEQNSSGMARKAKRTKYPEILSDESSSDEEEKKNKEESSEDEDKESEDEPPKKTSKREKPKQKATPKSKKSVKSANVKKADSSTTKKNQNSSKKVNLRIVQMMNL